MHALNFGLKRAHWSAVRRGKEVVAPIEGMTPARFDLLYLLRRLHLHDGSGLTPLTTRGMQSQVWKDLGLHKSTVSVLVRKLESMGWIRRERCATDRRTWDILLTETGLRRIFRAMRLTFQCRPLLKAYEDMFRRQGQTERTDEPAQHVVQTIDRLVFAARRIAWRFGDRSNLWYDYGCRLENLRFGLDWKMP
jgi:DNA-binding MarR family transcriptional regulator